MLRNINAEAYVLIVSRQAGDKFTVAFAACAYAHVQHGNLLALNTDKCISLGDALGAFPYANDENHNACPAELS